MSEDKGGRSDHGGTCQKKIFRLWDVTGGRPRPEVQERTLKVLTGQVKG